MEAAPKNRRGRGRPRAFAEEELGSPGLSRRQRQNRAYAERGRLRLGHLWEEDPGAPLCVLEELGRIRDTLEFHKAASWYRFHARRLTAKQAAATIRRMRTGRTHEEGPGELSGRLLGTVRDFRAAHPDASPEYVEREAELMLETVAFFRQQGY